MERDGPTSWVTKEFKVNGSPEFIKGAKSAVLRRQSYNWFPSNQIRMMWIIGKTRPAFLLRDVWLSETRYGGNSICKDAPRCNGCGASTERLDLPCGHDDHLRSMAKYFPFWRARVAHIEKMLLQKRLEVLKAKLSDPPMTVRRATQLRYALQLRYATRYAPRYSPALPLLVCPTDPYP